MRDILDNRMGLRVFGIAAESEASWEVSGEVSSTRIGWKCGIEKILQVGM